MFKFKDILAIILGAGIFSFGIYFLVIPFHFYEGGATGITLITYYLFKIPVSLDEFADQYPSLRSGLELTGQEISLSELTWDFLGFGMDGDF